MREGTGNSRKENVRGTPDLHSPEFGGRGAPAANFHGNDIGTVGASGFLSYAGDGASESTCLLTALSKGVALSKHGKELQTCVSDVVDAE